MPPAALQVQTQQSQDSQSSFRKSNIIQSKVYKNTKNSKSNRSYRSLTGESKSKNRNPNIDMDSINERKMQRPAYQGHGHVHGHGHPSSHPHAHQHTQSQPHLNISNHSHSHASSHPHSSYNRSTQHSSSSSRPRPRSSSSQNMKRHSKEPNTRRSSSNSTNNLKPINNPPAQYSSYPHPHPSHAVHPAPPQSNVYPNKDDINHSNMANGNLTNVPNSNMYSQSGHHNHHPNNTSSSIQGSGTTQGHPSMASGAASSGGQVNMNPNSRRPAYLLHRDLVIGKGSYGQVCIASRGEAEGHISNSSSSNPTRSSGKRKKFACKCVVLRNDPKYIAKLQEEVNVLRELRGHDNVIRLYDVFCVDNELFIITELGRGGDLFHLLTTHPKHGVTESYAAKTVAQMLSAVAFLHSRNICHRDLKLENWVLESGRDVWSPLKLIDFGLSTHFTPGHRLSRVVGSSYYVAPEVLKKSYTEACDLWSLGVIVYMLLSGAPPFYGKNDEAIKASIVNGEYTFPHELFRDVSDDAMAFVSTLLSYNTEYRYTADQALTHIWLSTNCDQDQLRKAKNGARGNPQVVGSMNSHGHINSDNGNNNSSSYVDRPEPMQM